MNVAVIPAKGKSGRLKNKNLATIEGRSLLWWTIFYARCNDLIDNVVVSTEDPMIRREAKKANAIIIDRPLELCGEQPLLDVYTHAFYHMSTTLGWQDIENIVGLQVDNVDRNLRLDDELRRMKDYNLLVSVTSDGEPNGAAKIYSRYILTHGRPYYVGVMFDDCTNIHYAEDLEKARKKIKRTWWYNERFSG
jgi:CMP-2-keto-3-deoxyoctulosonic acid synthetase